MSTLARRNAAAGLSLTICGGDAAEFAALPEGVRREVRKWQGALSGGTRPLEKWFPRVAMKLGVSVSTVRRKYFDAVRVGWRALIDLRKDPKETNAQPEEFVEWFRALAEQNQRCTRRAIAKLRRIWHARSETIPGYEDFPGWPNLPAGLSERNLYRLQPTKMELQAMRIGLGRAADHLPQIFATRVGCWLHSHIMFDDLWHDNFVRVANQGNKAARVLEFHALDYWSACKIDWGTKPRLPAKDGTLEGLKEGEMHFLLAKIFGGKGYSPRGTTLVGEKGTAVVPERIARILYDRTGGLIRVDEPGMTGEQQAVAGMYAGRAKGNFRFKAALESLGNLIHGELADTTMVPGQTGKDVEHRPEQLHGLLREHDGLVKAMAFLAPEDQARLMLPLLDYHAEFLPILDKVYGWINNRRDHALEGWEKLGRVRTKYRLSPSSADWLTPADFLALPPVTQAMLGETALVDPRYRCTEKLSPAEVYAAHSHELVRLPIHVIAEMLGAEEFTHEERVSGGYFAWSSPHIDAEDLQYHARVTDGEGRTFELREREIYLVSVNPFSPETLFVFDAKGRFVGIAPRVQRRCRASEDDAANRYQAKRKAALLGPVRKRHAQLTRQATARDAHNNAIIARSNLRLTELAEPEAGPAPQSLDAALLAAATHSSSPTTTTPAEPEPAPHHGAEDEAEGDQVITPISLL